MRTPPSRGDNASASFGPVLEPVVVAARRSAAGLLEQFLRHRDLGQEGLARREIAQGKKLLEEAIRDYPDLVKKYLGTVVPVTDSLKQVRDGLVVIVQATVLTFVVVCVMGAAALGAKAAGLPWWSVAFVPVLWLPMAAQPAMRAFAVAAALRNSG